MGIFRKRETYNEEMLRKAGLDRVVFNTPQPPSGEESVGAAAMRRPPSSGGPRAWDTATTAYVPGVDGDHVAFIVLPDGDLIVSEEEGDGDLSPLADAIETHLSRPYEAAASRQEGDLWGVGAREIEIAQFEFAGADTLELTQSDGMAELRADGEPSDAAAPVELQRLGEREEGDFCVVAERIDGDAWHVRVSPL